MRHLIEFDGLLSDFYQTFGCLSILVEFCKTFGRICQTFGGFLSVFWQIFVRLWAEFVNNAKVEQRLYLNLVEFERLLIEFVGFLADFLPDFWLFEYFGRLL